MFRLTLSAPASTAAAASASVRMPPPTASGMNSSRATARIVSASARRALERGGDVEDDELVDALAVVAARELGRIAGAPQPLEVDALDDLAVADVEAGDDAFGQHARSTRPSADEVPQDRQPDVARFLRVKLHAGDLAALHDRGERLAVFGGRDGVGGDGRDVAVREVHLRAGATRRRRSTPRCRIVEAVPADVRHLDAACPSAGRSRRHEPASRPRPGSPALRRCLRRATACRGRCRAADGLRRRARGSPRPTSRSSARVAPKWPTPGTMMPQRLVELLRRLRREDSAPIAASAFRTDVRLPAL